MSNVTCSGVNAEHTMDIPNDEGTEAKNGNPEDSMSIKDIAFKVVNSEGFLLLLGLAAITLDPLFFYVPVMNNEETCLDSDKTLIIVVVVLRTFVDILHDWSWWSKSLDGKIQYPRNKGAKKPHTCVDRLRNLLTWVKSCKLTSPNGRSSVPARVIAILACLPLPQNWLPRIISQELNIRIVSFSCSFAYGYIEIPTELSLQIVVFAVDMQSDLMTWIKFIVICQFVPRIFRTYPTFIAVTTSSNIFAWIGAAFNLLLFVFASQAIGGLWYLRAVERKRDCMEGACVHSGRTICSLYCQDGNDADNEFMKDYCAANATKPFDYGMYSDAIKSDVMGSMNFVEKHVESFWWGINKLSSMAQNLERSNYIWDTCFAILICVLGLVLFALLIGNLQMYLQSKMPSKLARLKELREELERWAPFSILPKQLRKEVSICKDRKWQEVKEVNLESLFNNIPWELKKKLKPYFCTRLFHKVEEFEKLDKEIKEELRERARAVVFQPRTTIHQEGYPIYEMIHIVHGKVLAFNNDDAKNGLPAKGLSKNDSFGGELLQKALESPLPKLPLATQTVQSVTKVEAFALSFDDFATIFTRHGRFFDPYKKEWAAHAITSALKKNTNIVKFKKSCQEGKRTVN